MTSPGVVGGGLVSRSPDRARRWAGCADPAAATGETAGTRTRRRRAAARSPSQRVALESAAATSSRMSFQSMNAPGLVHRVGVHRLRCSPAPPGSSRGRGPPAPRAASPGAGSPAASCVPAQRVAPTTRINGRQAASSKARPRRPCPRVRRPRPPAPGDGVSPGGQGRGQGVAAGQRRRDRQRRGGPVRGVLLQAAQDDPLDRGIELAARGCDGLDGSAARRAGRGSSAERVGVEGLPAGEQLVEHQAEGVDVAADA